MAHEIKRIEKEFVFKTVSDEGAAVSVHVRTHRYRGVFDPVHGTKIILTMEEQLTKEVLPKRVTLFFFFRSTPMTCKCIVQSIEGQKIHLEMPDRVYRDLGRSYERVQPEGNIGVSVLLDGQTFDPELVISTYPPLARVAVTALNLCNGVGTNLRDVIGSKKLLVGILGRTL